MYVLLDKDTIKSEILPHLSIAKRGFITQNTLLRLSMPFFINCQQKWSIYLSNI